MAAPPQKPFSHKYHLTQVSSCQGCHTTAETSTKASDNLLPDATSCVTCHDEVHIKEQPRDVGVQKFNHATHVKMGNVHPVVAASVKSKTFAGDESKIPAAAPKDGCVACHHGMDQSESITAANAKANYPQMAECLVCHSQINPPESCKKCHADNMTFRPASHTPEFSDNHSSGKANLDKASCAVCHGKKFTCKGCH
jgi:hypothetical protein